MLDSLDCKLSGFAELKIRWTADSPDFRFAGLQMTDFESDFDSDFNGFDV